MLVLLIRSSTSALIFGGNTPSALTGVTESWDGTSWTEVADLAVARMRNMGGRNCW